MWHAAGTIPVGTRFGPPTSNTTAVWGLTVRPHIAMRVKRIFPRVATNATGTLFLTDTPEVARDLEWILDRHPLDVDPDTTSRLLGTAGRHRDREAAIDDILSGHAGTTPRLVLGEPGLTARPHQTQFVQMIAVTRRLLLGDDLGLGKTISVAFMLALEGALPAAILVPTHLPRHWERKLHLVWPDLHITTVPTGPARSLKDKEGHRPDVVLVPYSRAHHWAHALAGQVGSVVLEEVAELRHGEGTQKGTACAQIARDANFVVGLSATPAYNYGAEIHNVLNIIAPNSLGDRAEFLREWGGGGTTGRELVADPAILGAYLRSSGLLLRRTRKDTRQELTDPLVHVEVVDHDDDALDAVADDVAGIAARILSPTGGGRDRFVLGGELDWRMRQATGLAKAKYVAGFVQMLLVGGVGKVVLWGWHRAVYDVWMDELAPFGPVLYTGSESPAQKNAAEDAFIHGEAQVLIMSLRSGAGLDGLQDACSVGVFGELDWSPKTHQQCVGRLDREGQQETVSVYYLLAEDGSDPVISEVLQVKEQQVDPIMDPDAPSFERRADPDAARNRVQNLARAAVARTARTLAPEA